MQADRYLFPCPLAPISSLSPMDAVWFLGVDLVLVLLLLLLPFPGGAVLGGRCPFGFDLLAAAADHAMQVTIICTHFQTRARMHGSRCVIAFHHLILQ